MPVDAGDEPSVTELLLAWQEGEAEAGDRLVERVYPELHRLAGSQLGGERREHTLEPAALVNEAYLRLVEQRRASWVNRQQFFAVASRVMRRILVDHARARGRHKRKGIHITLDERAAVTEGLSLDVLALDQALERLEAQGHALPAQVVQLRFFAGLAVEEVASVLDRSPATIQRAWSFAKAWLFRELNRSPG